MAAAAMATVGASVVPLLEARAVGAPTDPYGLALACTVKRCVRMFLQNGIGLVAEAQCLGGLSLMHLPGCLV